MEKDIIKIIVAIAYVATIFWLIPSEEDFLSHEKRKTKLLLNQWQRFYLRHNCSDFLKLRLALWHFRREVDKGFRKLFSVFC